MFHQKCKSDKLLSIFGDIIYKTLQNTVSGSILVSFDKKIKFLVDLARNTQNYFHKSHVGLFRFSTVFLKWPISVEDLFWSEENKFEAFENNLKMKVLDMYNMLIS